MWLLPERRRLSSNLERGTKSVSFLFPVQPVRFLWALTQGRPHDRIEHPGHLYFHGFDLHSPQTLSSSVGFCADSTLFIVKKVRFFYFIFEVGEDLSQTESTSLGFIILSERRCMFSKLHFSPCIYNFLRNTSHTF